MQHQVPAVIVTVTQHPWFRGQFLHDRAPLGAEGLCLRIAQGQPPVGPEEVPDEELEFPRQLVDVEGHAIRRIVARGHLAPAQLQRRNQVDGFAVARGMFGRTGHTEVCLKRDVSQVLLDQDAKLVVVPENGRHRQRQGLQQLGHPDKRECGRVDGPDMEGQHLRGRVAHQQPEVATIRGIARQRHDLDDAAGESGPRKILPDAWVHGQKGTTPSGVSTCRW